MFRAAAVAAMDGKMAQHKRQMMQPVQQQTVMS
jgi:hypothetical protein